MIHVLLITEDMGGATDISAFVRDSLHLKIKVGDSDQEVIWDNGFAVIAPNILGSSSLVSGTTATLITNRGEETLFLLSSGSGTLEAVNIQPTAKLVVFFRKGRTTIQPCTVLIADNMEPTMAVITDKTFVSLSATLLPDEARIINWYDQTSQPGTTKSHRIQRSELFFYLP